MTPQAETMLKRLKGAIDAGTGRVLPVPMPGNVGLFELRASGLIESKAAPAIYPRDYEVWSVTKAGWEA